MSGIRDGSGPALAAWLPAQRWFAGKARRIETVSVEDRVPLGGAVIHLVAVRLDDGTTQRYAVPLLEADDVRDALETPDYPQALLELIAGDGGSRGARGAVAGERTRAFPADLGPALAVRRLGAEQSNTSIALGGRLVLKHLRRLAAGPNPEEEIGRFLTERTTFAHAPRLLGHAEYRPETGDASTLAVVHELVADARDGWAWMLAELEAVSARLRGGGNPLDDTTLREAARTTLDAVHRLGTVIAELHRALASDPGDPAFSPEPVTEDDLATWGHAVQRQLDEARAVVGDRMPDRVPDVGTALRGLAGLHKIRHHGDFHLGQTLYRPRDGAWAILDFEGEPLRPLAERRRKACPLRDVAGLLRSLDYAATSAMPAGQEAGAAAWAEAASTAFVDAYRTGTRRASFVPAADAAFEPALAVFVLEKAAYEVVYEANHRPDWLPIPIRGLTRALAALAP